MAKNDFIYTTIDSFRGKLDQALKGDNAGPEILLAVQELLKEINTKYPQTAYRPDLMEADIQERKNHHKSGNSQLNNGMESIPEGVKYVLDNMAGLSKK